ncbi:hypothetical protein B0H21DRAFT_165890 [Amylocystis lapponica]|nr:hypothetical protein B0H21DRAFT_165890 [Amylocystis lapponica]
MAPPPKPKPPTRMVFATNSIFNTSVATKDDVLYYEVVTRYWHPNLTKIIKHDFEERELTLVAEIEGLRKKETRVRFGGEKGEWMSASELVKFDEKKKEGTFTIRNEEYRWAVHKRHLQLMRASDEDKPPVVDYKPYKRHFFVWRMSERASFEIKPEPELIDSLDRLITTYLLVERRRRDSRLRLLLWRL